MPPSAPRAPIVKPFFDRPTGSLQYVFHDPETMHGAIVDPVWNFCARAARTWTADADRILAYVRESWVFGDVSQGLLAVPLWIPQLSMAVGMVLLAVALVERLLRRLTGRPVPEDDRDAQGHGE